MRRTSELATAYPTSVGPLLVLAILLLASCGGARSTEQRLSDLGGRSCAPDSEFVCLSLEMPLARESSDGRPIETVFAVRPASGSRTGVLVTVVGGPGASGVNASEYALDYFDQSVVDSFDLVFFDQRGVGLVETQPCPIADRMFPDFAGAFEKVVDETAVYFDACIEESGHSRLLPHLGTEDAIQDLEVFRQTMGYGKLTIYGESYGTAFAQSYASEYPDSVERMVLDGPVDISLDLLDQTEYGVRAIERILDVMFEKCDHDHRCASEMGRPAREIYDDLLVELSETPMPVELPLASVGSEGILLAAEGVTLIAWDSAYSEESRMLFLRALVSYAQHSDLVPMARLLIADKGGRDGVSTLLQVDVNCLDSAIPGSSRKEETAAVADAWDSAPTHYRWMFAHAVACLSWPGSDRTKQPEPAFPGVGIPVMVVAAELDPATPYEGALKVTESLNDAYLLSVAGGSHVMFGRGDVCVDEAVNGFLLDGTPPPTVCELEVATP